MRLLIVIVNYRTASLVVDCLRSLAGQIQWPGGAAVVITDNASDDDSVPRLRAAIDEYGWSSWARVQPLDHNGGFAFGNNAAIGPALKSSDPPRFVLLLNPDTIVRAEALSELMQFMESHPQVGIAGARLEFPDNSPQPSACRFHGMLSELENGMKLGAASRLLRHRIVAPPPPAEATKVDWVSGACLLTRREVFEQIGLLDEEYFMYFEEVDFCRRARRAGWACWYVPAARVVHLIGQSSGDWDPKQPKKRRPKYWFASRRRYFLAHLGRTRTLLADLAWAGGHATYRLRRAIQRKPDRDPDRLWRDFVCYNFLGIGRDQPSRGPKAGNARPTLSANAGRALPAETEFAPRPASQKGPGVVVIGRNEGERLRRCLVSVIAHDRAVIYVDSNSSDGSPELARSLGATVITLDMSIPFSAARARNAGVEKLLQINPGVQFVQFIDGDCEMVGGWLERAATILNERMDVAALCGRLRERFPEHSVYNRLADLEWDTPAGEVKSCGGIAMMRLSAFSAAGGFDPSVVAGEEPELCQRLRDAGSKILRLPDEMAWHDSAMIHFSQWWTRSVRGGYGAMDVASRFGRGNDGLFVRQVRSARLWGLGLPTVILVAAIVFALWPGRWWNIAALGAVLAIGPFQIARMAAKVGRKVSRPADALAYGALMLVGKWANLLGQYRYSRDRSSGRSARLIEYKDASPARARTNSRNFRTERTMIDPDWQADLQRYPPRPFLREQSVWAVAVYRFGRRNDRRKPGFRRKLGNRFYWLAYRFIETLTGISIPKSAYVGPGLRIYHFGNIFVHSDARIGARCTLRQGVTIGNRRDGGPVPQLEDDVELGAYAQVLGGVRIGRGAKIGAMSVVLADVPAGATAVGVPAKILLPGEPTSEFRVPEIAAD